MKALHETASDTSLGTFIKNMAESTGNFTDEVKNSLFSEIGGEILEWAKDRVKILVNSSKMVIENVMSFLKPALTMLADVLWLTIEGLTYGGPWGAAAGAIVGFVVGLIETVPDIVRKYQKNTRQHAIVSGQDKRIEQME